MKILLIGALILSLLLSSCFRTSRTSSKTYFKDLIGFTPTADVKNLNSYSDELGIDASYWLAFECSDSTVDKIVSKLELTKCKEETRGLFGVLNSQPTSWWDTTFVLHSKPFYKEEERLLWYLWYDNKTKKAYFLTFDL